MYRYQKILFVNPGADDRWGQTEPLNLAILASFIESQGYDVALVDELMGDSVEEALDRFQPDLVAVTGVTPLAADAYRVAAMAKARGMSTVMGGSHASVLTDEVLTRFDMAVVGEGEYALLDILQKGLTKGRIMSDHQLNIDDMPVPNRTLLNMPAYLAQRQKYPFQISYCFVPKEEQVLNLIISRGCNARCAFCYNAWADKPLRFRNGELVVEELKSMVEGYGVRYFNFMDDNLFAHKRKSREIFQAIIDSNLDIRFGCYARVDCVHPEGLDLAYKAGLRRINFGFESGSQKILDASNKGIKFEKIEQAVKLCNERGIVVVGTVIIGHADETWEDLKKTRQLIRRLPLQYIGTTLLTPFPGTALWADLEQKGRIPDKLNWNEFDYNHIPIRISEHFSSETIMRLRRWIWIEAYLTNRKLLGHLLQSFFQSPGDVFRRIWAVMLPS